MRDAPALVGGARVVLSGGRVVASRSDDLRWRGFASIPTRLGGGFLLWSDRRLAFAPDFLGPIELVPGTLRATIAAHAWFSVMALNTPRGWLALDPRRRDLGARPIDLGVGTVAAYASDASHALRLDASNRGYATSDTGRTWSIVASKKGGPFGGVRASDDSTALLSLDAPDASTTRPSPLLADEAFEAAVLLGVELPGERVIAPRASGFELFSTKTGLSVGGVDLPLLESATSPFVLQYEPRSGRGEITLAATFGATSAAMSFDGALQRASLDATFPVTHEGSVFRAGPDGRLLYEGPCDAELAPILGPLDAGATEVAGPKEEGPGDDRRACVRVAPGRWIERALRGPEARTLIRWIPGDGGDVVAVVSAAPGGGSSFGSRRDGVRVLRLDARAVGLEGASISRSDASAFWTDERGLVRGWVTLDGDTGGPPSSERAAGIRVAENGEVTRFALPTDTDEVFTGGRFALALAGADSSPRWYESTDGGEHWRAIEGPPGGHLVTPDSGHQTMPGCSPVGCAWPGMARIGWGGPIPSPDPVADPEASPEAPPSPITVRCTVPADATPSAEGDSAWSFAKGDEGLAFANGSLRASIRAPFEADAAPRTFSVRLPEPAEHAQHADALISLLPLDPRAPVETAIEIGGGVVRARGAASVVGAELPAASSAVEAADGRLVVLNEHGSASGIWLAHGPRAALLFGVPPVEAASRGGRALARHGDHVALATVVSRSEVVASDLDLGRGELGPLERLGSLEALADPAKCAATGYRLVLRVSTTVALHGALDRETTTNANLLLRSSGGVLCLDAIEASVAPTGGEAFALRASFGAKPVARARLGGARVTCTVDPASAP